MPSSPARRPPLRAVALAYIDAQIEQHGAECADLAQQLAERRREIRWLKEERARIVADEGRP